MYDDYLKHYGVLGMKWGVRKRKNSPLSKIGTKLNASKTAKLEKTNSKLEDKKNKAVEKASKIGETNKLAASLATAAAAAKLASAIKKKDKQAIISTGASYVGTLAGMQLKSAILKYQPKRIEQKIKNNEEMIKLLKKEIGGSNNE